MPTSTSLAPACTTARSYMLRWLRATMTSFAMPVVSGSRFIFAGSNPARQAADASIKAAEAPAVTYPASAPVASARISLARPCSSAMSTHHCDASAIAAATSGRMMPPLSRVDGPEALTIVRMPSR